MCPCLSQLLQAIVALRQCTLSFTNQADILIRFRECWSCQEWSMKRSRDFGQIFKSHLHMKLFLTLKIDAPDRKYAISDCHAAMYEEKQRRPEDDCLGNRVRVHICNIWHQLGRYKGSASSWRTQTLLGWSAFHIDFVCSILELLEASRSLSTAHTKLSSNISSPKKAPCPVWFNPQFLIPLRPRAMSLDREAQNKIDREAQNKPNGFAPLQGCSLKPKLPLLAGLNIGPRWCCLHFLDRIVLSVESDILNIVAHTDCLIVYTIARAPDSLSKWHRGGDHLHLSNSKYTTH